MSNPKKKTQHLEFVRLQTAYISDADLIILGQDARHAAPLFLMYSGQHGLCGRIPSDPRRVQTFLMMDGGVPAAQAVVEKLLEAQFLVETDDPAWLAVRSWAKFQIDAAGSATRSPSNSRAALEQHHRNGKHPKLDREGCPLCAQGVPSAAPAANDDVPPPAEVPADYDERAVAPEPEQPTLVAVSDAPKVPTTRELVADIIEALDENVAAADLPAREYVTALEEAASFADEVKAAGVAKNPHGSFRNAILGHALKFYLEDAATQTVINGANRGAKALGTDGHAWYVHAAALAAKNTFSSDKHLLGWLNTTATNARSKGAAA